MEFRFVNLFKNQLSVVNGDVCLSFMSVITIMQA
jgi:hypothetical protein